jgi:putative flavoprotein involved in K+ transport
MPSEAIETVIIGAGQAGLAMSHHLSQLGREHIVLERKRVAERWCSERWDSLCFQAPNWNVRLPGYGLQGVDPDAFATKDAIANFITSYAAHIRAPLRCGVAARALRQKPGSCRLVVETCDGAIEAKNVVVATGPYQVPADALPIEADVHQLHSSQYRSPGALPPGAVLVIGSGNSGCQIAEELCEAGRHVFLSVSAHQRTPRRYRGKDCIWWNLALGDADTIAGSEPKTQGSRLMTGAGGGHDIDPRKLARVGVILLGRVLGDAGGGRLSIAADLGANLARGDASLATLVWRCDEHAALHGLALPPPDLAPVPLPEPKEVDEAIRSLDLKERGITTILWANGSRCDFSWVEFPVLKGGRQPTHTRGTTSVPGLYFLGLPWLHKWKSAFLFGVGEDAEHLAAQIVADTRV